MTRIPNSPLPTLASLDWDDLGATTFDVSPFALEDAPCNDVAAPAEPERVPSHSFVRLRTGPSEEERLEAARRADAVGFLDMAGNRQLNLTVNLMCLTDAVREIPHDRSARAAADTLRARIQELHDVHDALNEIYCDAGHVAGLMPLFASDAPLSSYLSGIYLWCDDVIAALGALAAELRSLQPEWATLRRRLADASTWYFDGLPGEIRAALTRLEVVGPIEARARFEDDLEELFWSASWLHQGLAKKFG